MKFLAGTDVPLRGTHPAAERAELQPPAPIGIRLQHVRCHQNDAAGGHSERFRGFCREVEDPAATEWASVIDNNDDTAAACRIGHPEASAERQGSMGCRKAAAATRVIGTETGEAVRPRLRHCSHRQKCSSEQDRQGCQFFARHMEPQRTVRSSNSTAAFSFHRWPPTIRRNQVMQAITAKTQMAGTSPAITSLQVGASAADQSASGLGLIWKCTAIGVMPSPPSWCQGTRSPLEVHKPRPFQPAFGSSMRPSRPLA